MREVQWSEGERLQLPYCRSGLDLGQCLNVVDEVLWMAIGGATHYWTLDGFIYPVTNFWLCEQVEAQ